VSLRELSPRAQIALVVVGLLAVATVAYFLVVAPKRSSVAKLDKQITATAAEIASRRAQSPTHARAGEQVGAADIFELTRAMPDKVALPEAILELNQVARRSGIVLQSIAPQAPVGQQGYQRVPMTVVFAGRYSSVSDFLGRLRNLVQLEGGKLQARGRLFSVESVALNEGETKFPQVQATATVNAFVFGGGAPPESASGEKPPAAPPQAGSASAAPDVGRSS
jgi:Tfp pilus assembly protein PilO